jgi:glycosyltransferase involved in cell wall biosynthesis
MKILTVAIPNHHFFQWVNQLEHAGFDVAWFDITDGAGYSNKISWVKQCNGWKLKCNFPFRSRIKNKLPNLYRFIQKFNERNVSDVFEKVINEFQPDIIHVFEMKLAGLPILNILEKYQNIPLIYSSWGSDLYDFERLGVSKPSCSNFLRRVDYLITDCQRDFEIAEKNGFKNQFLGVFPGNGGIPVSAEISNFENRKTIIVKGYEDNVGKAINVLKAIKNIQDITPFEIVVFSTDEKVIRFINTDYSLSKMGIQIIPRNQFLLNSELLKLMQNSLIYIGNSISDGMPNTLLEAMSVGAFPIQSNPGGVTEEVITHGQNGFLIENPEDIKQITQLIELALKDNDLLKKAFLFNTHFINEHYNRSILQSKIVNLYHSILK